jgi:hypothetical protein
MQKKHINKIIHYKFASNKILRGKKFQEARSPENANSNCKIKEEIKPKKFSANTKFFLS